MPATWDQVVVWLSDAAEQNKLTGAEALKNNLVSLEDENIKLFFTSAFSMAIEEYENKIESLEWGLEESAYREVYHDD